MKKVVYGFVLYIFSLQLLSCNKLVDVSAPIDKVTTSSMFNTDIAATSAVLGIYSQMMYVYLNLSSGARTIYTGLSSDELIAASSTSSDQKEFASNSISSIKQHILADLNEAISLLVPQYPTSGPVRPNKYTALALLARFYLYEKKWKEAEDIATQIIDSKTYSINNNLNNVFLANSTEAIWQLISMRSSYRSLEGNNFIPNVSSTSPPSFSISKQLMAAFEKGDKRRSMWINYLKVGSDTFYYPYKYKNANATPDPSTDYYTVFRLAEQYLIRAEARAEQDNVKGAADDLNLLRSRARDETTADALPQIPYTFTTLQMLSAVKQENRIELFCEWRHRWFDLTRHNEADKILQPIKPGWQSTDTLYPIPSSEMLLNPNLKQNPGYN